MRCFWYARDISCESLWKKEFFSALSHTCLFVPLVSHAALEDMKYIRESNFKEDNLLLEYEAACLLAKGRRLNILPVFIGDRNRHCTTKVGRFDFANYGGHQFPEVYSLSTKHNVVYSLISKATTVRDILNRIFSYQGVFLEDVVTLRCRGSRQSRETNLCNLVLQVCVLRCVRVCTQKHLCACLCACACVQVLIFGVCVCLLSAHFILLPLCTLNTDAQRHRLGKQGKSTAMCCSRQGTVERKKIGCIP